MEKTMSLHAAPVKTKKLLLVNSSWLFGDKILRMIIGLTISILMARILGPEQLGKWNYAESFFGMFMVLTIMGLDSIVVRDLVRDKAAELELMGTAIAIKLAGTLVAIAGSCLSILWLRPGDSFVISINVIIATASVFQIFDVIDYWFRSRMLSKYTVISKNLAFIISSGLKITLLLLRVPLIYVALCTYVEFLIGSIMLIIFYKQQEQSLFQWKANTRKTKELLGNCWPIILSSSAVVVQARIDQVIIGQLLGDEAVGQYSVALRLIEVLGFIPVVIATAFAPVVTRSKMKGEAEYKNTLGTIYKLMFIVFLLTAVPIFLLSDRIVILLYGSQFAPAGVLLALFAIRLFFTNFSVGKSLFITNENMFKYTLLTSIIGAASNIALNFLLIPMMGTRGSLVATIISFTISIFLVDLFFTRARENLKIMMYSIMTFWKINPKKLKEGDYYAQD